MGRPGSATAPRDEKTTASGSDDVQSIERAFTLLETIADHGGTKGLSRLADESGLPIPTIHRLLRTLVDLGYLRGNGEPTYLLARG